MGDHTSKLPPTTLDSTAPYDRKQRRKMILALVLVLIAMGIFMAREGRNLLDSSDTSATDSDASDSDRASQPSSHARKASVPGTTPLKSKGPVVAVPNPTELPGPPAVVNRTALPPLEVEVVAGDTPRFELMRQDTGDTAERLVIHVDDFNLSGFRVKTEASGVMQGDEV